MTIRVRSMTVALLAGLTTLLCLAPAGAAWAARKPKPAATTRPAVSPPAPVTVASVEGITEYRLANGLRVLLFPDPSKQTITVNITYLVGSRHENYGETGMAHLLEHLLFKGTPRHPDIPSELSAHGARPNGTTSWDRTNYYETFAASDENLRWALDLESDRMVNSFIAKKDLDSEMTVVRNEYEMGENNPVQVMFKRLLSVAYDWHNYGNTPIGARSDIEGVPIENLQAFYRQHYQPDNAVLLVAGKIDEQATLKLVEQYFGPLARPTRVLPVLHTVEPTQDGERLVHLRRAGDVQWTAAVYHIPSGAHPDVAALQILNDVLGSAPGGRLHQALVESGKAAAVFPAGLQLRDPGLVGYVAQVRLGQPVDPVLAQLIDIVEKPDTRPVTDAEVERARTQLLKQIELALNDSEQVGLALSDWMGIGDWRLVFLNRDRLKAVTTADVQRVWNTYLKPANRTAGIFHPTASPERVEIPASPDVAALVKDYQGQAAREVGETFDATPANIEARLRRVTLPGGMKLALLPKKTRGGSVRLALSLRFGDENSLRNLGAVPAMVSALLMRGTTQRTRQQLADEFDRLKANVSVNSWGSGLYVGVETTRENLPAVIALVTEVLKQPAFDAKELEQLRTEMLAGMEQQRSDPNALAFNTLMKHLNPYPRGDIRYVESVDEDIADAKAATREQLVKFHREFFGAQPSELAVVGDFDADATQKQVTELLAGWKNPKPYTRVKNEFFDVPPLRKTLHTPDKAQAMFVAAMNLRLSEDDPDYPALVLGNYLLGGGFLNSRLTARIRGTEGLSYAVGSQLSGDAFDPSGGFVVYAIFAPQNAAKLEQAFTEELARVLQEEFTPAEIEQARSGFLQGLAVSRAQDGELAGNLTRWLFEGRTLEWQAKFEEKIRALEGAQILAALRKHLDPAKLSIVLAGDFKK